jgi:hypothetical protein
MPTIIQSSLFDLAPKHLVITSKTFGTLSVLLDAEDYDRVVAVGKWCAGRGRRPGDFYFHKRVSHSHCITLHRFLMGDPPGAYVDHINHNTLDNRKANLRVCGNAANLRNGRLRPNNTSGHVGVRFDAERGKWHARIRVQYRTIHLGRFATREEAVRVRQDAEQRYWNM